MIAPSPTPLQRVRAWFASGGREPLPYQEQAWEAYLAGKSGLIHAPTGMGKTYAAWLGPVMESMADAASMKPRKVIRRHHTMPLRVVWLTPLRALAADIARSLAEPVEALGLPYSIELRTGDVSSAVRARQKRRLPTALVTTPESLSLLLSYPDWREQFGTLRCVVVDEWHELLSTKRGVQVELALSRLRSLVPDLRVWGLSATLGNLQQAMQVLVRRRPGGKSPDGELIAGPRGKRIELQTLIPSQIERFPWAGHLGARLQDQVIARIEQAQSTLLFTNTRSQAELWFETLHRARPDMVGLIGLHHGSLDQKLRAGAEGLLAAGKLKAVVCTSSLDLGVDFHPVDQVMQLGSPKGVARVVQRAGRSGHRPGATSVLVCVPTHAFELVEFAAARMAIEEGKIEPRTPLKLPMDVLVQHVVTVAAGGGFIGEELLHEVRTTHAFAELTDQQWQWVLEFVTVGGSALKAYPQYQKVVQREGRHQIASARIARLHRVNIGTITSDTVMRVAFVSGRSLGNIEESFISRLAPGDVFLYAGRRLELVRVREMVAYVRESRSRTGAVPRWQGSRFPLSTLLADDVLRLLAEANEGRFDSPEMHALAPLLKLQQHVSRIPVPGVLLVEMTHSREGHHLYLYPFAGRLAHEGLAALLAYRLARIKPRSITVTANDYGIELLSHEQLVDSAQQIAELFSSDNLLEDVLACMNSTQLARRAFRDIARVAGLVFNTYPREARPTRHLQASSDLFFDVFMQFDPENLLLAQARREVLEAQLDYLRLSQAIERVKQMQIDIRRTKKLSPLSFPLWSDRLRQQHISTEKWHQRLARMIERLEKTSKPRPD